MQNNSIQNPENKHIQDKNMEYNASSNIERKLDLILENIKTLQNQINELKITTTQLQVNQLEQTVNDVCVSVINEVLKQI